METAIIRVARELTLKFQDDSDIPERLKKGKNNKPLKHKKDSLVEQRFKKHEDAWARTVASIIKYAKDSNQAWRFIRLNPEIKDITVKSVTLCEDFIDFTELLIQRRDKDNCNDDELGKLCMLHAVFQKEIENKLEI